MTRLLTTALLLLAAQFGAAADETDRAVLLELILSTNSLQSLAGNETFVEAIEKGYYDAMAAEIQQYQGFATRYDATSVAIYVSLPTVFRDQLGPFPGTFCTQVASKTLHILNRDALKIALDQEISIKQKTMDGIKLLGRQYPAIDDRDKLNAGIRECYPQQ